MKKTITESDFTAAFHNMGRGDQFSHAGLLALFGYLKEMEEGTGEEMELDVISLCCEFSEYSSALECIEDCGYDFEPDEDQDEEDREEAALKWLNDRTTVITFDGGIIIQQF